jgi:predicted O-methyltransferase YrrM
MALLDQIYDRQQVETADGQTLPLHSSISREEGGFICNIIQGDLSVKRTLEVGCAYGLSSLCICGSIEGRPGAHHTMIDPHQNTEWNSVGIANLRRSGFSFFSLIEEGSEFALPRLSKERAGQFDFIFIDGWHTFDHTMIDCFYATRLLRVGGHLVIDDAHFDGISRVVAHLQTYPCYERVGAIKADISFGRKRRMLASLFSALPPSLLRHLGHRIKHAATGEFSMVALRKHAEDKRSWDWQADF